MTPQPTSIAAAPRPIPIRSVSVTTPTKTWPPSASSPQTRSASAALSTVSEIAPDFVRLFERAEAMAQRLQAFAGPCAPGAVRWVDAGAQLLTRGGAKLTEWAGMDDASRYMQGEAERVRLSEERAAAGTTALAGCLPATCDAIAHMNDVEVNRLQDLHQIVSSDTVSIPALTEGGA